MNYTTEYITRTLKSARVAKGLSQRALSARAGVPQSHISKIEAGAVDLRVSSLIALARVLDLELTLVPRKAVPAVNALIRSTARTGQPPVKALKDLQKTIDTIMKAHPSLRVPAQLQHAARSLEAFHFADRDHVALQNANRTLKAFQDNTNRLDALDKALTQLQSLRNALAHSAANWPDTDSASPAYSLEEDDDA